MTPFLLHDIVEPQWFDTSTSSSSSSACAVGNSLDRIERDEEAYMNQLRTSSLVYRTTNSGYQTTATSQYDHTNTTPTNLAMCYPIIGVPLTSSSSTTANDVSTLPSSTRMTDILLQFHQEAESIDLLCVHQQCEGDDEDELSHPVVSATTTTTIPNPKNLSFFSKYRNQYKELLTQQEQEQTMAKAKATTTTTGATTSLLSPLSTTTTTMKTKSNHHNYTTTTPSSVSSSSSMMSMNSSATSPSSMLFMSP